MRARNKVGIICWVVASWMVHCCRGHAFCGLEVERENKFYRFSLTSPLKNYPHGVLSEDGFYKIAYNASRSGSETMLWFQLCEQMVFNHDPPTCAICQTCGCPLHCGSTCSAIVANKVEGYHICTTLGYAANTIVQLIDAKSPGKGVTLNMTASTNDVYCSLSVSVYCNENGLEVPTLVSKSGLCNYMISMRHPAGCPAVTYIGNKGFGWLGTLAIVFLCIVSAYLLTGVVYRFFVLGIRGTEVIPNVDFWLSVPRKIQNGMEYALSRMVGTFYRIRYGSYTRVS